MSAQRLCGCMEYNLCSFWLVWEFIHTGSPSQTSGMILFPYWCKSLTQHWFTFVKKKPDKSKRNPNSPKSHIHSHTCGFSPLCSMQISVPASFADAFYTCYKQKRSIYSGWGLLWMVFLPFNLPEMLISWCAENIHRLLLCSGSNWFEQEVKPKSRTL